MRGDGSDYAALGLEPGAEPAEIDRAYKRLIKRHHPDREGGDAARAAEINHAYRKLRGRYALADPLILHADQQQGPSNLWVHVAVVFILALAALLVSTGPGTALVRQLSPKPAPAAPGRPAVSATNDSMDQPVDRAMIQRGVREALRTRNESELLTASQACARDLRQNSTIAQLDRCAAFDDTAMLMENHDPSWDGGPFSQPAVSRRQWSAASALSNDYLAVDGRLERIRVEVELAITAEVSGPPLPSKN